MVQTGKGIKEVRYTEVLGLGALQGLMEQSCDSAGGIRCSSSLEGRRCNEDSGTSSLSTAITACGLYLPSTDSELISYAAAPAVYPMP